MSDVLDGKRAVELGKEEVQRRLADGTAYLDVVVKGKWVKDNGIYKCSVCNDLCTVAGWANCIPEEQMYKMFKYCPNCGADMRGDGVNVTEK